MPTPRRKSMPAFMLEDGKENRSRDEDLTLPRPGIKRHSLAPGRSILKASNFDDNNTITVIGSNRDYKRRKVSFAASNRVISFDTNVSSPHTNSNASSNASDGGKSFMSPTKASQQKIADEYRKSPRRSPRLNPSSQTLKSPVTFSQERIKPPSPVKFNQKLTTLVPPKSPPGEPEIPESDESMDMETDDSPSSIPSARRHAPTGEGILINFESPAPKRNNTDGEKWNWTIPEEGEEKEDTGMDMTHINSYNSNETNNNEKEQENDDGPADDTMQFTSVFKPRSSEDTMQFTAIGSNNPPPREGEDDTMQFTSMFKPRQSDETMQFTSVGSTRPAAEARDSDETMQFTRILPPGGEKSPGDTMQFTSVFKPNEARAPNFDKADGDDTMQFTSVLPARSTGHRESEDTMQFTSVLPGRSSAPRESEDTMQFTSVPAARSSAPRESEDTMQFTSVIPARSAAPRDSEDTMQFTTIGSNNHPARERDDDTMQFTSVFPPRSSVPRESEDTMQFTSVLPPRSSAHRQVEDRPFGSSSAPRESDDTMQFTTILPGGPAKARDGDEDTMQFTSVPSTRAAAPRDSEDTMQFTSVFKPQSQRKEDDMTMEFTKIPKSVRTPKASNSPAQDKENVRLSLSTKATPPQPPRTAPRTLQEKIALLTPNKAIKVDGSKTTPSKFSPGFVKRTLFAEEQTKFTPLKSKGPKSIIESPSVPSKEAEPAAPESGNIGLKKFLEMVEVDFLDGLWSGANRMQDSFGLSNEPMDNPELEDYALAYNQFPTLELYDFGVRQLKERMKDMETELEEIDSEVLENTPELVEQFLNEPGVGRQYMMNLFRNSKILSRAEAKASWYDWRRTLTADVMKAMEKNKRSLEDDLSILNSRRETIDESLAKLTNEDAELTKQLEQLESRHKELENFDRDEYEKVQQALLEAKQALNDAKSQADVVQEVSPEEVEQAKTRKADLMKEVQAAEKLQRMNQKMESSMVDEISDKFKSLQKVTGIEQCRLVDNCLTATVFESLRIRLDLPTGKIETALVDKVKDDNCLTFFHSSLFEGLENPNIAQVCNRWRKVVELNQRMTIFRIKHITKECKIVQADQADGKQKLKLKVVLMLEAQTKAIIDVLIDSQSIVTLPQLQGQVSHKITYGQAQLQDLGDSFRSGLDKLDEALTANY